MIDRVSIEDNADTISIMIVLLEKLKTRVEAAELSNLESCEEVQAIYRYYMQIMDKGE